MCGYAKATRYEFSQAANNFSEVEFAGVVGFAGLGNINTGQRTHTRQIFSAVILVKKEANGGMADRSKASGSASIAAWKPKARRNRKEQLLKMRSMQEAKADKRQRCRIQPWQIELNRAVREEVVRSVKPDPSLYNSHLFLLGELYTSCTALSQDRKPEWQCPIKQH